MKKDTLKAIVLLVLTFFLATGFSAQWVEVADETGCTDFRVNPVDGTAFAWMAGVDLSPYQDGWHRIILHDSAGKTATGYILASAPAGETLGSDLLTDGALEIGGTGGDFNGGAELDDGTSDDFTNWIEGGVDDPSGDKCEATATVHGGSSAIKFTRTTSSVSGTQIGTSVGDSLYKLTMWTRGDGTNDGRFRLRDQGNGVDIIPVTRIGISGVTYTEYAVYATTPATCTQLLVQVYATSANGSICYFDDISLQLVTDPASSGAKIVNSKDGSTRNWANIDSGFDPNDVTSFEVEYFSTGPAGITNTGMSMEY